MGCDVLETVKILNSERQLGCRSVVGVAGYPAGELYASGRLRENHAATEVRLPGLIV